MLAQLAREVAQLLGEPGPRIVGRRRPCPRAPRRLDRCCSACRSRPPAPAAAGRSTASCGFGRSEDRDEQRASPPERRRPAVARGVAGTGRLTRSGALPARRRAAGGRTGRSRRPRRRERRAPASVSPARAGRPTSGNADRQLESARDAVAEASLGVDARGRSRRWRAATGRLPRASRAGRRSGWPLRRGGPTAAGRTARASRARARPRPRPRGRSSRDGRAVAARGGGDATPGPLGRRREPGRAVRSSDGGRVGRDDRCGSGRSAATPGEPGRGRHQASPSALWGGRRRSRQRRVGETNWNDSNRKITARTNQAATLFVQSASRVTPNGTTSAGTTIRPRSAARPTPPRWRWRASAGWPGCRQATDPWCRSSSRHCRR